MVIKLQPNAHLLFIIFLALISGGVIALASSLKPIWWAAWLGPALLIVTALSAPEKWRRAIIMFAALVAGLSILPYHIMITGWFAALVIMFAIACLWTSAVKQALSFRDRGRTTLAVLSIPAAFASIDTLLIHVSPHGSISSLTYSQMDAIPVIQLASLGGTPAVTFFTLMGASFLGVIGGHFIGHKIPKPVSISALFGGILLAGLIFGILRVEDTHTAEGHTVTMISIDRSEAKPTNWDAFWNLYGAEITQAAKADTVILLPEAIVELSEAEASMAANFMFEFATDLQVTIIIGVVVNDEDTITNRALVAEPRINPYWYNKQHLIPGLEKGITAGTTAFVSTNGLGVAICKDMHFPTLARDYSLHNVHLMLVPANDFKVDAWMMSRVTALRGVETGVSVVRTARNGLSTVSDPYGQFIGETKSKSDFTTLTLIAPNSLIKKTIYSRFGDIFGWLCLALWCALIFMDRKHKMQERIS